MCTYPMYTYVKDNNRFCFFRLIKNRKSSQVNFLRTLVLLRVNVTYKLDYVKSSLSKSVIL